MKTYIFSLFDQQSADPMEMPMLEFPPIEAESEAEAKETLFSKYVRLEAQELNN
jgi:hypothetical protein